MKPQWDVFFNWPRYPLIEQDDELYQWVGLSRFGLAVNLFLLLQVELRWVSAGNWHAVFLLAVIYGVLLMGVLGWYILRADAPKRLVARVDSDKVMLTLPNNVWPPKIEVPLPALRALKVKGPSFCFHRHDGRIKCVRPGYSPAARADVIAFLQRRLPASVALEVDQPKTDQTSAP